MSSSSKTFRSLSIAAGIGMVGTGAAVTLSHVREPDQQALVIAMAIGAAFAAYALTLMWREHRALAIMALIGIVLGEAFAYAQAVERILGVREERARMVQAENQPHAILKARVERLTTEVTTADAAVIEEAGKGGCKSACIDKKKLAAEARTRLEQAERELAATPPPKAEARLAGKLGIPQDMVDIALAGTVSLALLCFQIVFLSLGHPPRRQDPPEVAAAPVAPPARTTRHDGAVEFAKAYKAKHGRLPQWAEVRKAGYSAATASRALKRVD